MREGEGRPYTGDPREWHSRGEWTVESREAAFARSPEFARQFFDQAFLAFPELNAAAIFLRWSEQPDDVYAFFDLPRGGLGVQIDPVLDYVIVVGPDGTGEYADWYEQGIDSQLRPALTRVGEILAHSDDV